MSTNSITTRTLYNIRLLGAVPGFAGALRHILAELAKDPAAVPEGLFFRLPGSLRDRLVDLGLPEGLAPEFTGVIQQLGLAKLRGAGRGTTWFLMDPAFAPDLVQEPWITRAFEDHLERAELFAAIRELSDEVDDLRTELARLRKRPASAPVSIPAPIVVDEDTRLREFFTWAFETHHDPSRGEGLHLSNALKRTFEERFTVSFEDALERLEEARFLRRNERLPMLVWKGRNFPGQMPRVPLRVVGG